MRIKANLQIRILKGFWISTLMIQGERVRIIYLNLKMIKNMKKFLNFHYKLLKILTNNKKTMINL